MSEQQKQRRTVMHLNNAPIVEAVIDIQVQLPESKTLDDLHKVYEQTRTTFPTEKKRYNVLGSFLVESGKAKAGINNEKVDGFLFLSEDSNKTFQCRLDGFTFNKQKPYENWELLQKEAKNLWEIYRGTAEPIGIKRLALRYINKISLRTPFDPSNYFSTLPMLSPSLKYDMYNLFSQISIANQKISALANITEAIAPVNPEMVDFIFDIEVFKLGDFREEEIWHEFELLRDFKNEIFFESLKPATLKLLQ